MHKKIYFWVYAKYYVCTQGAKKSIFTACHSGKLKLAFTSPNVISTSPKAFWRAELISQFFFNFKSSKNITCPSGKLRTEFTCPKGNFTSPGLYDTTFFARCVPQMQLQVTPRYCCHFAKCCYRKQYKVIWSTMAIVIDSIECFSLNKVFKRGSKNKS